MGITSLLPFLEKSTRDCSLREFEGQTMAIDSYCWLHKGARACAVELAKGISSDKYITFFMKYVKLLLSYKIKPIMVFDGRYLPAKKETEVKRKEAKKKAKQQGMEYLRLGQLDKANKCFGQCVEVTPEMALNVIKECRNIGVDCIIAPYESDAQLAFFNINDIAQCVISEDSDLLLFGCKKVLYKMDADGHGRLVESDKIYLSMNIKPENYTFSKFRFMCILSGCDYIDSIPGIGLKKALKFIKMTVETDPHIFLAKVPRYLNLKNSQIPENYVENFLIADATFKHQLVFDPYQRKLLPLNPIEENLSQYCVKCGDYFDLNEAFQLALGNLNPLTMNKIADWYPDQNTINPCSIWSLKQQTKLDIKKPVLIKESPKKTDNKDLKIFVFEKLKEEHDKQILEELKFYKLPCIVPLNTQSSPEVPEEQTSPVLQYNPFVKKKISKFKTLHFTSEEEMKSPYFNSSLDVGVSLLSACSSKSHDKSSVETKIKSDFGDENGFPISKLEKSCVKTESKKMSPKLAKKRQPKQLTLEQVFKRFKK